MKEQRQELEAEYNITETRKALKEMGLWKALRPDGYQPGFFKRTWEVT